MTFYLRAFSLGVAALMIFVPSSYAAQLKSIDPKTGVLTFDDGRKAVLAGVQLEDGALKTLASILSGKNAEFIQAAALGEGAEPSSVYLYVQSNQIDFPPKTGSVSRPVKLMVNEFLLSAGLATVSQDLTFKNRESFLRIQEEAKKQGSGIWSRALPFTKKT